MPRIHPALAALTLLAAPLAVPAQSPQTPATQRPQSGAPRPVLAPNVWTIDKSHSELGFRIRHFMSRVSGTFRDWQGTVTVDDTARWENGAVAVTIQAASIFTDNDRRDADLRSPNFFAADSFPTIAFRSTRIERSGGKARIHGELTMRGVTRPVILEGEFLGLQRTGSVLRAGFAASTTINRLDYGITWNRVVEGGGVTLGDDVAIDMTIAVVKRLETNTSSR